MGLICSSPITHINPDSVDLSHFHLLKVVGRGGFGKVNAIQRKSNGELLALKRMTKSNVVRKESRIKMVWIERNIMSKLRGSSFSCSLLYSFQTSSELF